MPYSPSGIVLILHITFSFRHLWPSTIQPQIKTLTYFIWDSSKHTSQHNQVKCHWEWYRSQKLELHRFFPDASPYAPQHYFRPILRDAKAVLAAGGRMLHFLLFFFPFNTTQTQHVLIESRRGDTLLIF